MSNIIFIFFSLSPGPSSHHMPKLKVLEHQAPAAKLEIVPPAEVFNYQTLHALVVTFGPREAARRANLSEGKVLRLAWKNGWQQSPANRPPGKPGRKPKGEILPAQTKSIANQSPGNALGSALAQLKSKSTLGLATFAARAADKAAKHKRPLDITRKAKDISDVHKALWPAENSNQSILQIGFLIQG